MHWVVAATAGCPPALAGEHYGGSPLPPGVFVPTSGRIDGADAYHRPVAYERISIDPGRMSGLPCIRDTRVTVAAILGQLAAGRSFEQILDDYPYLERQDILAALEFAAVAVQERELPLARPA